MICFLCQLHLNIYLNMDLNRNSLVPWTYEYEYVSYVPQWISSEFPHAVAFIRTYLRILQVSIVVVVVVCTGIPVLLYIQGKDCIMRIYVNMVYDASLGAAAAVLLVLLLGIVSKDVYVAPNLREGLRITQLNHTYQVLGILQLQMLPQKRTADRLMWFSPQTGCAIWAIFRYV